MVRQANAKREKKGKPLIPETPGFLRRREAARRASFARKSYACTADDICDAHIPQANSART
eukprot:5769405-Pleurochrysis_carterae.AAC.1